MENKNEKKEVQIKIKLRTLIIVAVIIVMLLASSVFAGVMGYDNIFFAIKNLVIGNSVSGKEEILVDEDITISYKSINIADGVSVQVNRAVLSPNNTKIYISVKNNNDDDVKLEVDYYAGTILGRKTVKGTDDVVIESNIAIDKTKELLLVVDYGKITRYIDIDLVKCELVVSGNDELEKISEKALKDFISDSCTSSNNYMKLAKCLAINDIQYENGIYTVDYIVCYYNSGEDDDLESLNRYSNTAKIKLESSNNKFKMVEKGEDKKIEKTDKKDVEVKKEESVKPEIKNESIQKEEEKVEVKEPQDVTEIEVSYVSNGYKYYVKNQDNGLPYLFRSRDGVEEPVADYVDYIEVIDNVIHVHSIHENTSLRPWFNNMSISVPELVFETKEPDVYTSADRLAMQGRPTIVKCIESEEGLDVEIVIPETNTDIYELATLVEGTTNKYYMGLGDREYTLTKTAEDCIHLEEFQNGELLFSINVYK